MLCPRLSSAAPEHVAQSTHGRMHTAFPNGLCRLHTAGCRVNVLQVDIVVEDLLVEGQGVAAKPGGPTMTQHGIHVGSAGGGGNVRYLSYS